MEFNKKNIKIILGIISFTIIFAAVCIRFSDFLTFVSSVFSVVMPFVAGGAIAFVLNVFMKLFEEKIFKKVKFKKLKRITSLILTILLVLLVILITIRVVVPEVADSIISITKEIPDKISLLSEWLNVKLNDISNIDKIIDTLTKKIQDFKTADINELIKMFSPVLSVVSSTFGIVSGTISTIASSFIAIVFAIYVLLQKERLLRQSRQIVYALFKEKTADRICKVCSLSNKTFQNFITGQCTESLILGTMFFVSMLIFRMPYALMVALLIAVTSLIPIVGAFIGCIVGALLIFIESPQKAIIFIIMFLILQQIEGNLIYPHVVGNSVGLPSMWVLFAVTVGGNLMGVFGMLVFIPLSSVVYELISIFILKRLREKNIPAEKYINESNNDDKPEKKSDIPKKKKGLFSRKNKTAAKADAKK